MRVGRDEFKTDLARQQQDDERYAEGRGLIGGDPARRPAHVRWQPIPEDQPYFRLIDISDAKRARLDAFLHQQQGPLEIEVGFGSGEFLLGRAAANSGRRFLGFEVKRNLCRSVIREATAQALGNLWISDDDARWALPQLRLSGRVDVIHILYPDPWWKRKHQARRLFRPPFVALLHELLAPGGLLHVRSGVEGYVRLIAQVIIGHGGFAASDPLLGASFNEGPPSRREEFCLRLWPPVCGIALHVTHP